MAESPYKEYQDVDGDGKIDVCKDVTYPEPTTEPCPPCVPNANAVVPNWIEQSDPFLNERTCEYSVAVETDYEGTGGEFLEDRMQDQNVLRLGLINLLRYYNKAESETSEDSDSDEVGTINALMEVAYVADYHLGGANVVPRRGAKMKFLVVVPALNFDMIAADPSNTTGADEGASPTSDTDSSGLAGNTTVPPPVVLDVGEIKKYTKRVSALLTRYTSYHKIFHATEQGKIIYENGKPWNGITLAADLQAATNELFDFIGEKGYITRSLATFGRKIADKITIKFKIDDDLGQNTGNIIVHSITIMEDGCEDAANTYLCEKSPTTSPRQTGKGLYRSQSSAWHNPAIVGYFAKLNDMNDDATAREPKPWQDFVIEHTMPALSISYGSNAEDMSSCAGGDLNANVKDTVEDFLNEALDFSDVFGYKFAKSACISRQDKNGSDAQTALTVEQKRSIKKKIFDEESMREYSEEFSACSHMPTMLVNANAKPGKVLNNLWSEVFDKLKSCGMYSVMFESISCLMGGLSLEEALGKVLETALRNMTLHHMEKMWAGLPLEKKVEINEKLVEIWGSDDKPWFDQWASTESATPKTRSTLGTRATESVDAIKDAYLSAIFSVYSDADTLTELLQELNKFPGQEVIARVFAAVPCATQPVFSPPLGDFIKDLDLPFCRNTDPITVPDIKNPFENMPARRDLFRLTFNLALDKIKLLIEQAIFDLFEKILSSLCSDLCAAGSLENLAALGSENVGLVQTMIREAFCGEDASEEDVNKTLEEMFGSFASATPDQLAEMANESSISDLMTNISSVITQDELVDLIDGNCNQTTLNIIYQLIVSENPEFLPAFYSPSAICEMFKGIGDLMPASLKDDMENRLNDRDWDPAFSRPCLSICPTDDQLTAFEDVRCSLLSQLDGTTEDQCAEQFQKLKDRTLDDLDALSDIAQKGLGDHLGDVLPEIIGDSCNAILPTVTDQQAAMAEETSSDMAGFLQDVLTFELVGRKGMLSYVLSDTMGQPYTRHLFRARYLPFIVDSPDQIPPWLPLFPPLQFMVQGFLPSTVARHLQSYMQEGKFNYSTTYDDKSAVEWEVEIETESYGFDDDGNETATTEVTTEIVSHYPGKMADVTLSFRDNNKGRLARDYTHGFDIEIACFPSQYGASFSDDASVRIYELFNLGVGGEQRSLETQFAVSSLNSATAQSPGLSIIDDYTILSSDDGGAAPQIQVLQQIVQDSWSDVGLDLEFSVQDAFDSTYSRFLNYARAMIASNDNAFTFGYQPEEVTEEDIEYMGPEGDDELYDPEKYPEEMQILGRSRMLADQGSALNRVHYMDPAKYGGRYHNPPLYISPAKKAGVLGIAEALVPDIDGCEPSRPTDVLGLKQTKEVVDDIYKNLPFDERLNLNPDCVVEPPYARILDRESVSAIESDIITIIRTYILEEFIKGLATFTQFKMRIPDVFDKVYIDYVIDTMERDMKENSRRLGIFKDEGYWYAFLEQCVQSVDRKVKSGIIEEDEGLTDVFEALNTIQEDYDFPFMSDLETAVSTEEEVMGRKINEAYLVLPKVGLKKYRRLKALETVQKTEGIAKIIMRQTVEEQMEFMTDNLSDMLSADGFEPKIDNIYKHFLGSSGLCLGSTLQIDRSDLTTYGSIKDVASDVNESDNITEYISVSDMARFALTIAEAVPESTVGTFEAVLENKLRAYGLQDFLRLYEALSGKGTFVLEKYIYVEDSKKDMGISDSDYSLRGVVNISTFKEFLDTLDSSVKAELVSDYFGNLSILEGNMVPVLEGETSEEAGHVHEYRIDENGNGIAYEAYPAENPTLKHEHKIEGYFIKHAYSPAAKQLHSHTVEYEEATDPAATLAGSIGLRYGVRVCYIPSAEITQTLSNAHQYAGLLDDATFIEQSQLSKAYHFGAGVGAFDAALASVNAALPANVGVSVDLSSFKYMFPIASYEIDVLDQTLGELASNIVNDFDPVCLIDKLVEDPKFRLMFENVVSLPRCMSMMAIYNTKAYLPSIGQVTDTALDGTGNPDTAESDAFADSGKTYEGEWETYLKRSRNGFAQSPWDRWDQMSFKKLRKYLRSLFLGNYNSDDSEYVDEDAERDASGRLSTQKMFQSTNYSIPIPWFKRRKLINRPFSKSSAGNPTGEECD
jgi:hypothetical protein